MLIPPSLVAIYRDLGYKCALDSLFEDVAWLAALQGDGQRAVRLRAAASLLRDEINAPLTRSESEKLTAALEPTRKLLSSDEFTLAETEEKSISLEDAISYVLS